MLKFWSKIGLFLQIAIVVAAVILFNLFDPFGWLKTKKLTLEDTPVSVKSIREIGKLISAEYYGEVLTSLHESIIEEIKEDTKSDEEALSQVEEQFKEAIRDLHERKNSIKLRGINKRKKLYDLFYKDYGVTSHPFYQTYIQKVIKNYKAKNEKKLLKMLYDRGIDGIDTPADSVKMHVSYSYFKDEMKRQRELLTSDKKFRKSQIVVLGRGWVKAGIDFGTFNEKNFKYDKENKTIHLVGLRPKILFSTINPWFIPEKQIKGFEIVVITKRAKKPEYMKKVKSRSLKKLRQQAIQSGILEQAKKNAEDNLKSFFSLLIPEGIDEVIIHDDFFSYFDASFVSDTLTAETMQSIDSLFINRYHTDSSAVISLRDSIYAKEVFLNDKSYPVNRYSSRISMAEDDVLSEGEMKWLKRELKRLRDLKIRLDPTAPYNVRTEYQPDRLDSIWFYPRHSLVDQFRRKINDTSRAQFSWSKVISDHPDYSKDQQKRKDSLRSRIYRLMAKRRLSALEELEMALLDNVTQVAMKGFTYIKDSTIKENTADTVKTEARTFINSSELKYIVDSSLQISSLNTWKIPAKNTVVTLDTYQRLISLFEENWSINNRSVIDKRNLIMKHWMLETPHSGLRPASRFIEYHLSLMDSTQQILAVDSTTSNLQEVTDTTYKDTVTYYLDVTSMAADFMSIKQADAYINNVKLKNLNLSDLTKQNDMVSQILYYPSATQLKMFNEKANSKWYWSSGSKKKRLKKTYLESLIQNEVLKEKRNAFEATMKFLLEKADVVYYTRRDEENGIIVIVQGLPAELSYFKSYVLN